MPSTDHTVYVVISLNYCSQNGGNVYRDPYYNGNPNIGPRIIGNLDLSPRDCQRAKSQTNFFNPLSMMRSQPHQPTTIFMGPPDIQASSGLRLRQCTIASGKQQFQQFCLGLAICCSHGMALGPLGATEILERKTSVLASEEKSASRLLQLLSMTEQKKNNSRINADTRKGESMQGWHAASSISSGLMSAGGLQGPNARS